jgi:hypothetical protein
MADEPRDPCKTTELRDMRTQVVKLVERIDELICMNEKVDALETRVERIERTYAARQA